jgi:DNA repair ATPase RecN
MNELIEEPYLENMGKRIAELEQEQTELKQTQKRYEDQNVRLIKENAALKSELDQCLTIHAKLNDAYHIRGERMQELWDFCKNIETYKEHLAKWFTDKGKIK